MDKISVSSGEEADGKGKQKEERTILERVNGVNLGNWLVLEKWMNPALFAGTKADDEYWLAQDLPEEVYEARIKIHRSEYISERDFVTIASWGCNTVRIPIPYFVFGDRAPFLGCIEELDRAFRWAEHYGLKILLDLHTVPGSQNGFDNGGLSGVVTFGQDEREVEFVLSVLERLAERYGKREGLWGIEPLNEPLTEPVWDSFQVEKRYPARIPEMAAHNRPISFAFLEDFYKRAYERIRRHMGKDKVVLFHDGFSLLRWEPFFRENAFENAALDTHQYLMMAEMEGCPQTTAGYEDYIKTHYAKDIAAVQQYVPVICGEWCLFNSLAVGKDTHGGQSVLNGVEGSDAEVFSKEEKRAIYQALARASLDAWSQGNGQFYWSYKLLTDTVNEKGWIGWDAWDLGRCADFGWYPVERA